MCKTELKQQAIMLIEQLSADKLKVAHDYLAYLQDKEAWEATHELMSDPEVVESLKRAEADVKAGRLKRWDDVKSDI